MTRSPPDRHFEHPTLAAVYDVTNGWAADTDFYLALTDQNDMTILDLGCGTGVLTTAYAMLGHQVVGLDPAEAMLDVARQKEFGDSVQWVCGFAQDLDLDERFDLIVMTGHAFQALTNDADIHDLFRRVATHLTEDGRFVFETRNPSFDWCSRWADAIEHFESPQRPFTQETRNVRRRGDIVEFEHVFRFETHVLRSASQLRFPSHEAIEHAVSGAGLVITSIRGDWNGNPFDPTISLDLIFEVRRPEPH